MNSTISPFMQQFIRQQQEAVRYYELKREADAATLLATSIEKVKRTKPLDQQITELMRSLPPALRDRPWSMDELVSRLSGKYRDRPHPQHVGEALRRLGWKRERRWSDDYDGKRVWVATCC